ncbi:MAG: phospholipid carrier-dependent glycosyltransferase, partial [Butyrivibrio sp.]
YGVCMLGYRSRSLPGIKNLCVIYILNPVIILCIVSAGYQRMLIVAAAVILLYFSARWLKKKNPDMALAEFYPEYISSAAGAFFLTIAMDYFGQDLAQCFQTGNTAPVLFILSCTCLFVTELLVCIKIIYRDKFNHKMVKQETENIETAKINHTGHGKFALKDFIIMACMTILYGILLFSRLGSTNVPETYRYMTGAEENKDIVLYFGKDVEVSRVSIYLGVKGKSVYSFSTYDATQGKWDVFDSKHTLESAFCWNNVDVNRNINSLGIELMQSESYLHEIIILDKEGNVILPENASDYPELFDEQDKYPEYATYYYRTMFDEVYHARTAYEFVHDMDIYENTHPPLGKTIIGIGIQIFGMNPFGWRFMCALFGTLMIPVTYLFAWRMFRKTGAAAFTTGLMFTEFMHFVLSGIATLDILVGLFILLMFYFMYCYIDSNREHAPIWKQYLYLGLSGLAMALGIATKWTAMYAAAGLAIIFFVFLIHSYKGRKPDRQMFGELGKLAAVCVMSFIVLPAVVYVLSYVQFTQVYTDKGLIETAIDNSKLMLSYHSSTVFEHPYSSEWYEWIIDKCTLLDALTVVDKTKVSSIATFGNPLILWGGIVALLHNVYLWRCHKDRKARFLCIAYTAMLVPWLFIHRTVFIYHYFANILILIMLIGNSVYNIRRGGKKYMIIISCISLGLFIFFYPVLSGMTVPIDYLNQALEWFKSWRFV